MVAGGGEGDAMPGEAVFLAEPCQPYRQVVGGRQAGTWQAQQLCVQ